ncbi:MAG: protein kinase [Gemmataceae bacterium]|nr:protein kinase [Gemmataceae bacterium]
MLHLDSVEDPENPSQIHSTRTFGAEAIVPLTPFEAETVPPTPPVGHIHYPEVPNYTFVQVLQNQPQIQSFQVVNLVKNQPGVLHVFPLQQQSSIEERVRFRRQLEAVHQIRYPHVSEIHEIAEIEGLPYLVTELVNGESLDHLTQGRVFPTHFVLEFGEILAKTVGFIHEAGLCHGFLSPRFIRFENTQSLSIRHGAIPFGNPKIEGLFLSALNQGPSSIPSYFEVALSERFCYLAPELLVPQAVPTPTGDIYALGAILYELVVGRPPFLAATYEEYRDLLAHRSVIQPSELVFGVDDRLEQVILKCLEKSPSKRYPNGKALAEDLGRLLNQQPPVNTPRKIWHKPIRVFCKYRLIGGVIAGSLSTVILLSLLPPVFRSQENSLLPSESAPKTLSPNQNPRPQETIPSDAANPNPNLNNPNGELAEVSQQYETITQSLIEKMMAEADRLSKAEQYAQAVVYYDRILKLHSTLEVVEKKSARELETAALLWKLSHNVARTNHFSRLNRLVTDLFQIWSKQLSQASDPRTELRPFVEAFENISMLMPKQLETEVFAFSEQLENRLRQNLNRPLEEELLARLLQQRAESYHSREKTLAAKAIQKFSEYADHLADNAPPPLQTILYQKKARLVEARFALRNGDLKRATELFDQVLSPATVKELPISLRIDCLVGCAEAYYRENKERNAETTLILARSLAPCENIIQQMYGRLSEYYLSVNNRPKAKEFADLILKSPEKDARAVLGLIRDWLRHQDGESAKNYSQQAIAHKVFDKKLLHDFLAEQPEYPDWLKNPQIKMWLADE